MGVMRLDVLAKEELDEKWHAREENRQQTLPMCSGTFRLSHCVRTKENNFSSPVC